MMAAEEQRINCGGGMTTTRRKDLDHNGTLEAILYNLSIGNGMNLDDGCRGDGVNQHPKITVSTATAAAAAADATSKGLNSGSHHHKIHSNTANNGSRPLSQFLQVPQADLSKLTVMPCHE